MTPTSLFSMLKKTEWFLTTRLTSHQTAEIPSPGPNLWSKGRQWNKGIPPEGQPFGTSKRSIHTTLATLQPATLRYQNGIKEVLEPEGCKEKVHLEWLLFTFCCSNKNIKRTCTPTSMSNFCCVFCSVVSYVFVLFRAWLHIHPAIL